MPQSSPDALGHICILDLESSPDPMALALQHGTKRSSEPSSAIHRIEAASLLSACEMPDGSWTSFRIASIDLSSEEEPRDDTEILLMINKTLIALKAANGLLVTYNGLHHDMPLLRRRAARNLLFDLEGIFSDHNHQDLLLGATRPWRANWYSLRDAAAGLGIPVAYQTRAGPAGPRQRKAEVDVAATFLLMLFELAMARRTADPVMEGWRGLANYIESMGPHGEHLAQYRRHRLGGGGCN